MAKIKITSGEHEGETITVTDESYAKNNKSGILSTHGFDPTVESTVVS